MPLSNNTSVANNLRRRQQARHGKKTSSTPETTGAQEATTAKGAGAPKGGDKLNVNMLSYPLDTAAFAQGHYVIFQLHSTTNGRLVKEDKPSGFKKRSFALKAGTKRVGTQIALYMPPSVSVSYKTKYGDVPISSTAEQAINTIGAVKNAEGLAAVGEGAKGVGKTLAAGGKSALAATAGTTSNALAPGLKELAFVQAGKIVTDKMELVFEGVDRRTFNFEFNFIPKSRRESEQVDQIVNAFKIAMLPEYTSSFGAVMGTALGVGSSGLGVDTGQDRTLSIPTTMDIKYYVQTEDGTPVENRYLNRISTCYLQDMDVEYGGDRYTAYEHFGKGAPPQQTKITLMFQEIEIITKEAAREGY